MDKSTQLQMATRIHFALLRQFGENIEITDLIKNQGVAREALWVCEASGDIELMDLARQFKACCRAVAQAATHAEKDAAKSDDAAATHAPAHPHTHPIGRPVGRMPSKAKDASTKATPNLDLSNAPGLDPAPPPVVRSRMLPPAWFRRASTA